MSCGISEGKQNKKIANTNKGGRVCLFSTNQNDDLIVIQNERFEFRQVLTPGRTCKFTPAPWYKGS